MPKFVGGGSSLGGQTSYVYADLLFSSAGKPKESTWVKNLYFRNFKITPEEEFNMRQIIEDKEVSHEKVL